MKTTRIFSTLLLVGTLSGLVGCNYQVDKGAGLGQDPGQIAQGILPSFDMLKAQVVGPKCLVCHNGTVAKAPDLTTYDKFMANINDVLADLADGSMPKSPGQPLTAQEKNLLLAWINGGAPKDGGQKPTDPVTPPTPPTPPATAPSNPPANPPPLDQSSDNFKTVFNQVLDKKCSGCHDGTDPKIFDISSYTEIAKRVAKVKELVTRHGKGQMPPAKKAQLTPDELAVLLKWLDAGAPEGLTAANPNPQPIQQPNPQPPAELLPTYKSISQNIFETKCMKCHAEGKGAYKDYALAPLSAIVMGKDQLSIVKKDANSTLLVHSLIRTDAKKRMPRKGNSLTQQEVETIKKWIALGCPQ